MDHLSDLVTTAFPDSKIALEFSSKHTKTRSIVKHVIAKRFRCELEEILQKTKFSLIIDETTGIAACKQLTIVVRFFSDRENRVKSKFLKLIEVTMTDASMLTLAILSLFESKQIPVDNMIGYASDTTNVMFGEHHSVVSLLKECLPNLFVMKCRCHSAHFCASHACEKFPRAIEDLARDIYSYFCHRLSEYETNTKPHQLLKASQTRWLLLANCVSRIIEQWSALEAYFEKAIQQDCLISAQNILSALQSPIIKL